MKLSHEFLVRLKLHALRQYKIAQEAGIGPGTLSQLVNGAQKIQPEDRRIIAVGKVLGLTAEECFAQEDESEGEREGA